MGGLADAWTRDRRRTYGRPAADERSGVPKGGRSDWEEPRGRANILERTVRADVGRTQAWQRRSSGSAFLVSSSSSSSAGKKITSTIIITLEPHFLSSSIISAGALQEHIHAHMYIYGAPIQHIILYLPPVELGSNRAKRGRPGPSEAGPRGAGPGSGAEPGRG